MRVGIIVYSQTGNTHSVARKLQEKLAADGHAANIEQVTITGDASPGKFQLTALPAVEQYDALVLGAPVQAFALTPVMTAYLKQLSSLGDKKVACFVTKQLPFYWTGGRQAVAKMKKICQSKGAVVSRTEIVIWFKSTREQSINQCVENLSKLFR